MEAKDLTMRDIFSANNHRSDWQWMLVIYFDILVYKKDTNRLCNVFFSFSFSVDRPEMEVKSTINTCPKIHLRKKEINCFKLQ